MFEAHGSEIEALKSFSSDHLPQETKTLRETMTTVRPTRLLSEFDLEDVFRRELMDVRRRSGITSR